MCKMIAAVGLIVGVSLFLLSFIANAYNKGFFLTMMFGFGTFLGILMDYIDIREKACKTPAAKCRCFTSFFVDNTNKR
jgi:hypothetical protein